MDSPPKGRVVIVDIETTGSTLSDEVIQIAAMEVLDGAISGAQFFSTVSTNRTISPESSHVRIPNSANRRFIILLKRCCKIHHS